MLYTRSLKGLPPGGLFGFEIRVVKSVSGAYDSQLTKNAPMEQMNPYASAHLQSGFQTNIHASQSIYCSR
jgi:hypothetical protein